MKRGSKVAKKYKVEIPAAALKETDFDPGDDLSLSVSHKQFVIRSAKVTDQTPQINIGFYTVPALLMMVIFFVYSRSLGVNQVALTGEDYSIANAGTLLGTISGIVIFVIAAIWTKVNQTGPTKELYWRNLPTIVIACGLILAFSFSAAFWLLGRLFMDASFDIYTSTVMIFMILAVVNYVMINLAMTLTTSIITNLLTIMIIGGMLFAMLTNSSRDWWKHNFSFLGTAENSANFQFNVTLIFSGALMLTLVDYLFVNLQKNFKGRRILILRWLLYALSACIASIGLFPNDPQFHILHDRISMWLVYIILILIVALRWILPRVTKQFLTLSYTLGVVMGVEYIVFKLTDYLSLTAFELLEFGLAFSWLLLLLQNIENLANFGHNLFIVTVKDDSKK